MINPRSSLAALFNAPVRPGRLIWIGLRPARRATVEEVESAAIDQALGLDGDHYSRAGGARQLTLISAEGLSAAASHLGLDRIDPALARRNLVVQGVNLLALKGRRVRVGDVLLEVTGECHPCSMLETAFGPGGYNAFRGLGGITARAMTRGVIQVGATVSRCDG